MEVARSGWHSCVATIGSWGLHGAAIWDVDGGRDADGLGAISYHSLKASGKFASRSWV